MTLAQGENTNTQPATAVDGIIEGIDESVVWRYFQTMNTADYEGTAALFAPTGALHPPFEEPIEGTEAITTYLKAEAKGMQLFPRQGIAETLEEDQIQVQVKGKVQTSLFGVNVAWIFILNPEREILYAQIKLLASPQELLNLRR
jgi:hypothetical protein